MPLDPRLLERMTTGAVITEDRFCDLCRYNLRGLQAGGRCPECGHPIAFSPAGVAATVDNLTRAPLFYLKTVALGSILLVVGSIGSILLDSLARALTMPALAVPAVLSALLWWAGVVLVTTERPLSRNTVRDVLLDRPHLRWLNRTIQPIWLIAVAGPILSTTPLGAIGALISAIALAFALLATVPLAIYLSALAEWASHTGLSARFRVAAWGLALAGPIALILPVLVVGFGPPTGLLALIAVVALIVAAICQILFLICIATLCSTSLWAIGNARSAARIQRRAAKRRQQHEEEMAARTVEAIELSGDVGPPQTGPAPSGMPVLNPPPGVRPYPVDPGPQPGDP